MNSIAVNVSPRSAAQESISPFTAVVLHLAPGLLITLAYFGLSTWFNRWSLPPVLALLAAMLLVTLPVELGVLLYQGYRHNGQFSLEGVVFFREPLPWGRSLAVAFGLLVWAAIASTLMAPVDEMLRRSLFSWWPGMFNLADFATHLADYPRPVLMVVAFGSLVLNILIPWVEELYFRGYMLPRMSHWGRIAPIASLLLFSLYHFWIPWQNPSRIVALLPVILAVFHFRSVRLSILVHAALNTLGSIALLVMVFRLP